MPQKLPQFNYSAGKLLSMSQAAAMTPYSGEYLGLLARKGKLSAVKIGRDWLTTEPAVKHYMQVQAAKHTKALALFKLAERRGV